jgi:hypothetical protein
MIFSCKRYRRTLLVLASLLITIASPARTALAAEPYSAIMGIGTSSCTLWSGERGAKKDFPWDQWLLGFVSGASHVDGGNAPTTDYSDGASVLGWIEDYCRAHPLDQLAQAARAYVVSRSR